MDIKINIKEFGCDGKTIESNINRKIEFEHPMTSEGIVWNCVDKGWTESRFWFKTKGLEHSLKTSNKEKVPVDVEKINSVNEFINEYVSENRLLQGLDKLRENNLEFEIKNIGFFLKWVYNDIIKEELDTIVANNLEPKDLGSPISNKARNWFITKLNEQLGI